MSDSALPSLLDARKVVVFRALNLGDMLCSIPALRALRRQLPQAHITLVGLPSALPVLERFSGYVDEFVAFPGDPAFPEQPVNEAALAAFYQSMQARRFDLALQMHGSGQRSNEIVLAMQPAQWLGFVPESKDAIPGRLLPWPMHLHEVHRYLALLEHAGLEASDDSLDFPLNEEDAIEADALAEQANIDMHRAIFLHAGARLASRRWPVERYATVARALESEGWQIVLTGSHSETPLLDLLQAIAGRRFTSVCGDTSLGTLAALLKRARLLICNDTGISHVAAAVKAPSIVIASGSDVARWAPLDTRRHVVLHAAMACRPCAYDICPIGHTCALAVNVDDVLAQVQKHLRTEVLQ